MHALLGLSSLLLVMLGGHMALGVLRRLDGWSRRRDLQLAVLAAPIASLGVGLGGLHHFVGRTCFLGAPPWDYTAGVVVPLVMGLAALGDISLGAVRVGILHALLGRRGRRMPGSVQHIADSLAVHLGVSCPRVLLWRHDRPLALTYGIRRPTVLLSTWMLEHLDRGELEAVLAHELGHVRRRDYLVTWIATVLRDAFFYLPTSRMAYRLLHHEKELASDELAITVTHRPLALASALAKVWQQALDGPTLDAAQTFVDPGRSIEARIERLLAVPQGGAGRPRHSALAISAGVQAMVGLLALTAVNVVAFLTPMGCGLSPWLGRL